jgi:pimeloyl-ACP methyl ester carboxylesterase
MHYVASQPPQPQPPTQSGQPIVIFMHGFPDSWAIWRHPLSSSELRDSCTMIALDLPGYGGSDSMSRYGATEVLEALTEFIVTIREQYGVDGVDRDQPARKVVIVAHDWGAVLGFRLASEAPQLADRFVLMNGPLVRSLLFLTT